MSTHTQHRPRPGDDLRIPTEEGEYVDGTGERCFVGDEPTVALHHRAVEHGWDPESHPTPYERLKAALKATNEYARDVSTIRTFAFAYVTGYGPNSTPQALEALREDDDVHVPGGEE
jgi:hypothetical protein